MRVKLYKRVSRKAGKEYVSYFINLPKKAVELMSFTAVNELELEVKVIDGKQAIVIYKP